MKLDEPFRPNRQEILAADGRRLRDILRPGLRVVFCGTNPSLYSAAVGHHFARPGNRFWPALYGGGFTPRRYTPWEDRLLLDSGFGLTNIVARPTARAEELSASELAAGAAILTRKMIRYRPAILAVLGVSAYRVAFNLSKAVLGLQSLRIGVTSVWILPNPSGLNAHFQLPQLSMLFGAVLKASQVRASAGGEP